MARGALRSSTGPPAHRTCLPAAQLSSNFQTRSYQTARSCRDCRTNSSREILHTEFCQLRLVQETETTRLAGRRHSILPSRLSPHPRKLQPLLSDRSLHARVMQPPLHGPVACDRRENEHSIHCARKTPVTHPRARCQRLYALTRGPEAATPLCRETQRQTHNAALDQRPPARPLHEIGCYVAFRAHAGTRAACESSRLHWVHRCEVFQRDRQNYDPALAAHATPRASLQPARVHHDVRCKV